MGFTCEENERQPAAGAGAGAGAGAAGAGAGAGAGAAAKAAAAAAAAAGRGKQDQSLSFKKDFATYRAILDYATFSQKVLVLISAPSGSIVLQVGGAYKCASACPLIRPSIDVCRGVARSLSTQYAVRGTQCAVHSTQRKVGRPVRSARRSLSGRCSWPSRRIGAGSPAAYHGYQEMMSG